MSRVAHIGYVTRLGYRCRRRAPPVSLELALWLRSRSRGGNGNTQVFLKRSLLRNRRWRKRPQAR